MAWGSVLHLAVPDDYGVTAAKYGVGSVSAIAQVESTGQVYTAVPFVGGGVTVQPRDGRVLPSFILGGA